MPAARSSAPGWRARVGLWRSRVIYGRPWKERRRRRFYRPFVTPGQLCFDIGAHLGNHSAAWLALGARVLAVEPQPLFAAQLRQRFAGRDAVTLCEAAVAARTGRASLAISDRTPTVSSLSDRWRTAVAGLPSYRSVRWDRVQEVETVTLDALIARFGAPDFCKLDIEGSEAEALSGLSTAIAGLSFEASPGAIDSALTCIQRLSDLGNYEYNISIGEEITLSLDSWAVDTDIRDWLLTLARNDRSCDVLARLIR